MVDEFVHGQARAIDGGARWKPGDRELHMRRGTEPAGYELIVDHGSPVEVAFRGGFVRVERGDLLIADACQSMTEARPGTTRRLAMSDGWVRTWLRDVEALVGRPVSGASGWGAAISHFIRQAWAEGHHPSIMMGSVRADSIGLLLSLHESEARSNRWLRHRRSHGMSASIKGLIVRRACETGLSAADVALSAGVEVETLHGTLAARGESFSGLLASQRMLVARKMLESPNFDRMTTAEVGRRSGFSDPSHFIRTFAKQFRLTPWQFRSTRNARQGQHAASMLTS